MTIAVANGEQATHKGQLSASRAEAVHNQRLHASTNGGIYFQQHDCAQLCPREGTGIKELSLHGAYETIAVLTRQPRCTTRLRTCVHEC
jgi:hypothetical protein